MRVHVAFTPAEAERAPTAIVVDVLRATSTIAQALASGYRRVLCCAEVEEAFALKERLADAVLGGERKAVAVPGFDLGNSPREYLELRGETLILTTTNGTRAILSAAAAGARPCSSGACSTWRRWPPRPQAGTSRWSARASRDASPSTMPTARAGSSSCWAANAPMPPKRQSASPGRSRARKRG